MDDKVSTPAAAHTEHTRVSTSELLNSCEITPPERRRQMKIKGEQIANELKEVALGHGEDVFSMLGNIASEDTKSDVSSILLGANNVVFAQLGAKETMEVVLSEDSKSALFSSIRVPDWVYLLAKVRMRISDAAWQTLLNLTQIGRTG
ncbi:Hypothetical predicted protein, partial [Paramuricea clavata]